MQRGRIDEGGTRATPSPGLVEEVVLEANHSYSGVSTPRDPEHMSFDGFRKPKNGDKGEDNEDAVSCMMVMGMLSIY